MSVTLIRGDALDLPLAASSVDLVVTSPPYFGLRSYTDDGRHYAGQVGDEPTPAAYVGQLVAATREMIRVLKPAGSLWINLGDRYSGGTGGDRNTGFNIRSGNAPGRKAQELAQVPVPAVRGMRPKTLIGIPWRFAVACIDDLGLILRAELIWSKPNALPESVTDRVRRSHETWFHFTKDPRYFSAVDEIREPTHRTGVTFAQRKAGLTRVYGEHGPAGLPSGGPGMAAHPLGTLPGSVWSVATQPLIVPPELGVDHYAAFPMEWPRRLIAGWSPAGVCTRCGAGRRPVTDRDLLTLTSTNGHLTAVPGKPDGREGTRKAAVATITGYACACSDPSAPTRPAVVLDPFGGTGTTALVAHVLGRHGISVDRSADYCRLAAWRTSDPNQLAAAAQVDKPPEQVDGQLALFDTPA